MKVALAGCVIVVGACSALAPKPLPPVVHTDTVVVTKEVAAPLPAGDSAHICLGNGMTAHVLIAPNGDTLVGATRVRTRDVRPALTFAGAYAPGTDWFATDTIRFDKRLYRKAGAEQKRDCDELKEIASYNGVLLFAEVTAMARVPMILVPVRPGIFQPYTTPTAPLDRRR